MNTAEEIKKEIIERILSREYGSWESIANDAYDEGHAQGLAASHPPAAPVSGDELKASDELMYMIERAALESLEKIDWLNYPKDMFRAGAKWALSATLPTREQRGEKEKFAIRFSEWLMIQCEYKNHCVWEYRGEEYTQNELIEIFKRTTPLPSPPKH